ncbi:MAG: SCO family protein [Candidatus Marinimicrobia bacterium]|nr:SCO family protein [Candidatus Neomarinimicrobiota bacterium]MCF7829780.1 SCO family protein [Candidatus Neomarinimicrobiota bacterium]MCF7881787.1 SCO family protein [Candidatus Neomarinimicrobiota bacterium]
MLNRPITLALVMIGILSLAIADPVSAQISAKNPQELQKIDVDEHLGETIPLDLEFTDHNGNTVTLEKYFRKDKPVLLTLAYYECPMLCTLVLNGISKTVDSLSWTPGKDYQIVTVSIDPRETAELAKAKHDLYLEQLDKQVSGDDWAFLVGEESQSKKLADALGFNYYYVEDKDIYAHPAVSYVLTEKGKISRYLYGINFKKKNLRLALTEGSEGEVGTITDKVLLYCYQYNPDADGYVLVAENVMKLGGALTVVILGSVLGVFWWREKHKDPQEYREQEVVREEVQEKV